ncbi:MAG: O-antigen ligase family protein [Pseudomonadota bacterium]
MIFLLPATALTTDLSVGLIEATLLLGAIACAKQLWRQGQALSTLFSSSRLITLAFAVNLLAALGSLLTTGFEGRFMENPAKMLLVTLATGLIVLLRPSPKGFWFGLAVGTLGAAGFAVYQKFYLLMPRAEGFSMPITFGNIAIAMALMSLAGIQVFARTRWAALPYIAFVAGVSASILSGSRGGWLALLLCIVPIYSYGRHGFRKRTTFILAGCIALLVTACVIPETGVRERLTDVSKEFNLYRSGNPNSSVGARLEMWQGAWVMFAEHPITGVGRANYNDALKTMIARGDIDPAVEQYRHAHSEMLHALATQGLPGLLALLCLYAAPLLFFNRQLASQGPHRPYALAGLLLCLSYVDFGLTQVMFSHHVPSAFYALTVCVLAGLCLQEQLRAESTTPTSVTTLS